MPHAPQPRLAAKGRKVEEKYECVDDRQIDREEHMLPDKEPKTNNKRMLQRQPRNAQSVNLEQKLAKLKHLCIRYRTADCADLAAEESAGCKVIRRAQRYAMASVLTSLEQLRFGDTLSEMKLETHSWSSIKEGFIFIFFLGIVKLIFFFI